MTASTERSSRTEVDISAGAPAAGPPLRMAAIGMSTGETCGVRDHATLLAEALARENVSCSMHWLQRSRSSFAGERSQISSWARELADELSSEEPDALLLHYSVFSHSHRGIPLFVPRMLAALRETSIPLISFLHEYAFQQRGRASLQSRVWGLSQRGALLGLMRASTAAIVTVEERVDWFASRRWLPARPLAFAPVFSTLPPPSGRAAGEREGLRLGLFGYSCRPAIMSLVLDALALAREHGFPVELMLLGSPGPRSAVGETWMSAARSRSLEHALRFSGTVSPQELSDMLAGCDLLLFADGPGPTSRKTTLAGSLASGTAVVATDGHGTWRQLIEAEALELAEPRPDALAGAIERLLADESSRVVLGARGRAFAEQSMGAARSAAVVAGLIDDVLDSGRRQPGRTAGAGSEDPQARDGVAGAIVDAASASAGGPSDRLDSHSARARP